MNGRHRWAYSSPLAAVASTTMEGSFVKAIMNGRPSELKNRGGLAMQCCLTRVFILCLISAHAKECCRLRGCRRNMKIACMLFTTYIATTKPMSVLAFAVQLNKMCALDVSLHLRPATPAFSCNTQCSFTALTSLTHTSISAIGRSPLLYSR